MPLRSDDFEHTSNLTYEMVTSHRQTPGKQAYYELIVAFLIQQQKNNSYQQLILAAPEEVLVQIKQSLPPQIRSLISAELAEDLLARPDNLIEQHLISHQVYPQAGVRPQ